MADTLSVGVVGAGGIARSHLQAIATIEGAQVKVIMDVDGERARAAAEEFGGRACTSLDDILGDEVEAVHVCTPHNLHADQVVAALEAGKHVFVEKPMALTVADCDRMLAAAEAAHKVLMVGQVMRHFPVNLKARQLIAEGAIGQVHHLMRRRYSFFNPSEGEGARSWYMDPEVGGNAVLFAFGTHEYDILPWYLQSPVVRVYAQGTETTELYHGQKDFYCAVLTHANGAVSLLSQSIVCRPGAQDQFIVGSEGTLSMTNRELDLNGEKVEVEGDASVGMPNQIREFVRCCLHGGEPDASGRSVRHTMAVIEAVALSAEQGEPVAIAAL